MREPSPYFPGQRWVSATEPELGLGRIISADRRFVEVAFAGNDCKRKYGASSAPLKRVIFKAGDIIKDANGAALQITSVKDTDANGTVTYVCGDASIPEEAVLDSVSGAPMPLQRLLSGIVDRCADFSLRAELLHLQAELLQSPIRGFCGGRMELMPHQLSIASEVSSRRSVRVLLADETGLGKTIEACLILHRLILVGKVRRCLICVPESLVHQWFIELLRRFNLMFRLFSKEHFDAVTDNANPFQSDQFGIISMGFLAHDNRLCDMAVAAGWDMVIVDEAHHLRADGKEYECVRRLSERSEGLILLTATPEQSGTRDHFLRLKLLDPLLYSDFDAYEARMKRLVEVSEMVDRTLKEKNIDLLTISFDNVFIDVPNAFNLGEGEHRCSAPDTMKRISLMQLIDRLGVGRVMFRTTRQAVAGFPRRIVHLEPLLGSEAQKSIINDGYRSMASGVPPGSSPLSKDVPRIVWLTSLLKTNAPEKFLVICAAKEKASEVRDAVQESMSIDIALFHEDMTLLQRDRNAAWFTEKCGARVLICSEIGSEGRNFQCCHNLVLFDLPLEPEVLEQRIGRLDRIGQGPIIHIFIPYAAGTHEELLCRWYHEGIMMFEKNVPAAGMVGAAMRETLMDLFKSDQGDAAHDEAFIRESGRQCAHFSQTLCKGRDRLLEIASFQPGRAERVKNAILEIEKKHLSAKVMELLFKHYGVAVEDANNGKWQLITDYVSDHRFPLPRHERPLITYDREIALLREDIEFISIDHPMVIDALDLFLSSDFGTSVFAIGEDFGTPELLLESLYVLECVAPDHLNAARFLPPSPIRAVVNNKNEDVTAKFPATAVNRMCKEASSDVLQSQSISLEDSLPRMQEAAEALANRSAKPLVERSLLDMRKLLDGELDRLRYLQGMDHAYASREIELCEKEKEALEKHLAASRVRLDSIRVIWRGRV